MVVSRVPEPPAHPPTLPSKQGQQPSVRDSPVTVSSHDIQLRHGLANTTFKALCTIRTAPTRQDVLRTACLATEFRCFPLRQAEKSFFRELNHHTAIPYTLSDSITQPWQKVFLLVQADLLQQGWPNKISATARKELHQDASHIRIILDKVLRCIADILGERRDGRGLSVTLDVLRSIKARVWEGAGMDLRQVSGIGPASFQKLADAGIKSVRSLASLEFYHIERLLSRNPPYGQQMLHQLKNFPQLAMSFSLLGQYDTSPASASALRTVTADDGTGTSPKQVWIARALLGYMNEQLPAWRTHHPWITLVIEGEDGRLVWFWRGSVKRLVGRKELVMAINVRSGETLQLIFACEEVVGTMRRETHKVESSHGCD